MKLKCGLIVKMAPALNEEQQEFMNKLYYEQKYTRGRDSIYKYIRTNNPEIKISRRQVMEWLKKQEIYQLNVAPPKQVGSKPIAVLKPGFLGIDLIEINGTFVLTVVDIFTKFAGAAILKNKKETTTYRAFLRVIKTFKEVKVVLSDQGSEFNLIEAERDNLKIKYIRSKPANPWTNGNIERFNGTIKRMLSKTTGDWRLVIPKLIDNYNNTIHSTTESTPIDAYDNIPKVLDNIEKGRAKRNVNVNEDFKVGDDVRVVLIKGKLDKKSSNTYTREVYKIVKVVKSSKPYGLTQYKLEDSDGDLIQGFYNATSLQKINVD